MYVILCVEMVNTSMHVYMHVYMYIVIVHDSPLFSTVGVSIGKGWLCRLSISCSHYNTSYMYMYVYAHLKLNCRKSVPFHYSVSYRIFGWGGTRWAIKALPPRPDPSKVMYAYMYLFIG